MWVKYDDDADAWEQKLDFSLNPNECRILKTKISSHRLMLSVSAAAAKNGLRAPLSLSSDFMVSSVQGAQKSSSSLSSTAKMPALSAVKSTPLELTSVSAQAQGSPTKLLPPSESIPASTQSLDCLQIQRSHLNQDLHLHKPWDRNLDQYKTRDHLQNWNLQRNRFLHLHNCLDRLQIRLRQ